MHANKSRDSTAVIATGLKPKINLTAIAINLEQTKTRRGKLKKSLDRARLKYNQK
jgi:hypothetical protein